MSAPLKVGLPGFGGRMGQMIGTLICEDSLFEIVAATEAANSDLVGSDISCKLGFPSKGVEISDSPHVLGENSDVIIDFTQPEATMAHLQIALETNTPMVIGTTGLNEAQEKLISNVGKKIPIIYCANTSIGITLLLQQARQIASKLDNSWDIEVLETHHNKKVDAPSGTALALGRALAQGRSVSLSDVRDGVRDGNTGPRKQGNIGFSVLRGGDVAGEHSVIFFGKDERIELVHKANDRVIFARGALKAAQFIATKLNQTELHGYFTMDDVLA